MASNPILISTQVDLSGISKLSGASGQLSSDVERMARQFMAAGESANDCASALKNMGYTAAEVSGAMKTLGQTSEVAGEQVKRSLTDARFAAVLLSQEMGVHMPRAMSTLLARSETLGPLLNAAFSSIAIVGFIALAVQAAEKLAHLIDETFIFTKAEQDLYNAEIAGNKTIDENNKKHIENLREIQLLGKSQIEQDQQKIKWAREDADVTTFGLADKLKELDIANKTLATLRAKKAEQQSEVPVAPEAFQIEAVTGVSDDQIKKAEIAVTELTLEIGRLRSESTLTGDRITSDSKKMAEAISAEAKKALAEKMKADKDYIDWSTEQSEKGVEQEQKAYDERTRADQKYFNDKIALSMKGVEELNKEDAKAIAERLKLMQEMDDREISELVEADKKKERLQLESFKKMEQGLHEIINGPLDQFINKAIMGKEKISIAFRQLGAELVAHLAESLLKMSLAWLEHWALIKVANATGNTEILAQDEAIQLKEALISAKTAAGKAFADVPFPLNLIVAPAVFAATLAISAEQGAIVPGMAGSAVPMIAHAQEMVLPSDISAGLQQAIRGGSLSAVGSNGHTFAFAPTVHAMDEEGVDRVLVSHHKTFIKHVSRWARNGAFR